MRLFRIVLEEYQQLCRLRKQTWTNAVDRLRTHLDFVRLQTLPGVGRFLRSSWPRRATRVALAACESEGYTRPDPKDAGSASKGVQRRRGQSRAGRVHHDYDRH
jgi:hypothetical protein